MAAVSSSSSAEGSPAHTAEPAGGGGGPPYGHHRSRFGDTTLTKVFVGGLAWETPSEGLREHFQGYGEILEAVVITDRETGRSKGYGFVSLRLPLSFSQCSGRAMIGRRLSRHVRTALRGMCSPQVTFRDPEAAQRAVQNPNPVIAGRRANCNIASMGPPRPAPPRGEQTEEPNRINAPPPSLVFLLRSPCKRARQRTCAWQEHD
jgi:hypothetical protein